jgi:hypothetical protein
MEWTKLFATKHPHDPHAAAKRHEDEPDEHEDEAHKEPPHEVPPPVTEPEPGKPIVIEYPA